MFLGGLAFIFDALGLAVLELGEGALDLEGLADDVLVLQQQVEQLQLRLLSLRNYVVRRLAAVQLY